MKFLTSLASCSVAIVVSSGWGFAAEPKNPFELKFELQEASLLPGQPIRFTVTFQNRSDQTIPFPELEGGDHPGRYALFCDDVATKCIVPWRHTSEKDSGEPEELLLNQKIMVFTTYWPRAHEDDWKTFRRPGKYQLDVRLIRDPVIRSESAELTIREPVGVDEAASRLFYKLREIVPFGRRRPTKEVNEAIGELQELIGSHPNNHAVDDLRWMLCWYLIGRSIHRFNFEPGSEKECQVMLHEATQHFRAIDSKHVVTCYDLCQTQKFRSWIMSYDGVKVIPKEDAQTLLKKMEEIDNDTPDLYKGQKSFIDQNLLILRDKLGR